MQTALTQNQATILSYLCGARRLSAEVLRAKLVAKPTPAPIPATGRTPRGWCHPKRRWTLEASPVAEPTLRVWVATEAPSPRPGRPATFEALRASLV